MDPELKCRLTELSKETGRTESFYIKAALNEYLDDLEDEYLAAEALRQFEVDQISYSHDEVVRLLGLDD